MIINRCFVNETLEKLLKDGWQLRQTGVGCLYFSYWHSDQEKYAKLMIVNTKKNYLIIQDDPFECEPDVRPC